MELVSLQQNQTRGAVLILGFEYIIAVVLWFYFLLLYPRQAKMLP